MISDIRRGSDIEYETQLVIIELLKGQDIVRATSNSIDNSSGLLLCP